jgi:hypothetical protein
MEELTKEVPLKDKTNKQKNTLPISQPPSEITTELLLKYQHQDWMLEEKQQNLNQD